MTGLYDETWIEAEPPHGTECILLVEDDTLLRTIATRALGTFGYDVTAAVDGIEALQLLLRDPRRFDIVVSDVVMPRMSGLTLHREVRALGLDIPILLTSAYTAEDVRGLADLDPSAGFIQKPWSVAQLATAVRNILDGDPAGRPN